MKQPDHTHPISITPSGIHLRVMFQGRLIADSVNVLEMREASYGPVHYIPLTDTDLTHLIPSKTTTHCPYKGDASYYSIDVGGKISNAAVWFYDNPYPAVAQIKDHLAFYRDRVDVVEIGD